jgi:FkbM family methyltransferase
MFIAGSMARIPFSICLVALAICATAKEPACDLDANADGDAAEDTTSFLQHQVSVANGFQRGNTRKADLNTKDGQDSSNKQTSETVSDEAHGPGAKPPLIPTHGITQWQLALNGSLKASSPDIHQQVTTQTFTNTPFPCASCDCSFIDRNGVPTHCDMEINSRMMVARWLPETSTVLEVGARYGSNSCAMAAKQKQSGRLVVVDADRRVWTSLEKNRLSHSCNFHTVRGVIGRKDVHIFEHGYGTLAAPTADVSAPLVPHFTLEDVQQQYNVKFDAANFDCEGCLPYVLKDFPELPSQLKLLMIEAHNEQEEEVVGRLLTDGWELVDIVGRQRVLVNQSRMLPHREVPSGITQNATYWFDADTSCQFVPTLGGFRANVGLSCEQVCAKQALRCSEVGLKKLSTQAEVSRAFNASGAPCTSFVEHTVASYWAGPWNSGGVCGYSSNPQWQPNCRGKAACGFHLACSCE